MEPKIDNRKFVAYYRVSKDSFKDGKSKSNGLGLESQNNIANHFHKNIVKEFTETKSAKNISDRPILQEAIKYCLENDCWLVVAKLDRLSRNVDDIRAIIKQLDGNVSFCDIPCEGKADIFTITIFAAFAERERELISLRTKQALKVKKERGEGDWHSKSEKWNKHQKDFVNTGEFSKMGIMANKDKALMNENTIRASEIILDKKKAGKSYSEIAEILNEKKFTTPNGLLFHPMSVQRIHNRYHRVSL